MIIQNPNKANKNAFWFQSFILLRAKNKVITISINKNGWQQTQVDVNCIFWLFDINILKYVISWQCAMNYPLFCDILFARWKFMFINYYLTNLTLLLSCARNHFYIFSYEIFKFTNQKLFCLKHAFSCQVWYTRAKWVWKMKFKRQAIPDF